MTPVHQDAFDASMDAPVPGNCMQAAVATVLDLPLQGVPHFLLFGGNWLRAMLLFLNGRGRSVRVWTSSEAWAADWAEHSVIARPMDAPDVMTGVRLVSGQSPRGNWLHMVVYRDGVLAHDPHPDGTGIVGEPVEVWAIV